MIIAMTLAFYRLLLPCVQGCHGGLPGVVPRAVHDADEEAGQEEGGGERVEHPPAESHVEPGTERVTMNDSVTILEYKRESKEIEMSDCHS